MATYYWVGGSGNWNATSTANWSNASGGSSGFGPPTSADDVIFDAGSNVGTSAFTVTVTGTSVAPAVCRDFSTGGAGGALDGAMTLSMGATAQLDCYGSMTLPATNLTWSGTTGCNLFFRATTTGKTITTNGVSLGNTRVELNGVGGEWTLGSAFTSTASMTVTRGSFSTSASNYALTLTAFASSNSNTRTVTFNGSTITLSLNGTALSFDTATNLTLNTGTSTITCSAASPTFTGGGQTFYNVTFSSTASGSTAITGAGNTFNNLTQASRASTGNRNFTLSGNQTINGTLTLGASNTAVRRIFVLSSVVGTQRTITLNGTLATLNDVDFRDIAAAGTAGTWTGTRLGNCLGNSNITFDAPKTVYWNLAGSQNWSSTGWATTNNGTPAVNNFPLAQDTAVFTEAGAAGTVTLDVGWFIGSIQMADGVSNRTTAFTLATGSTVFTVYGNVTFFSNLIFTGTGTFNFRGQGLTQTITSAGVSFPQSLNLDAPSGTVQLLDNLTNTGASFTLSAGTLDLSNGNRTLTCVTFSSSNSNTRAIAFGTSGQITVTGNNATVFATTTSTGLTITGTPVVNATYSGGTGTRGFSFGPAGESNSISLNVTAGTDQVNFGTTSGAFKNVNFTGFSGNLQLSNSINIFGNLTLSTGMTVILNTTQLFTFAATSGTQTVTTNGKTIDYAITVNAPGATVQLQDNLTLGSSRTFTLTAGTLDLTGNNGNWTLTTGTFATSNSNTRSIAFGTGSIVCSASGTAFNAGTGTNLTTTGSGTISLTSASAKTFAGGGRTYPTLNQGGSGTLTITGANTFNSITNTVQPATINFPANTTTTVTTLGIAGTAGNLVSLYSATPGTRWRIVDTSGITNVFYADIKDSDASGGAIFIASNSTNSGNNVGWTFGDVEDVSGSITAVGTVSSDGIRLRTTQGFVTGSGDIASDAVRLRAVYGDVQATGVIDAKASETYNSLAAISAVGIVVTRARYEVGVNAPVSAAAEVDAQFYKIGEEWADEPEVSDTWTVVSASSNVWTDKTIGTNTWQ